MFSTRINSVMLVCSFARHSVQHSHQLRLNKRISRLPYWIGRNFLAWNLWNRCAAALTTWTDLVMIPTERVVAVAKVQ